MLRRLQVREMPESPESLEANCDLCGTSMPEDHRHLLQLDERSIVCACESCWALRSGDAEYVPTGSRVVWLDDLDLPDDLWARFQIPIGLAFFLRTQGGVVAFYPSPAGATESELDLGVWGELCAKNPVVADLEPEAEALIVDNRSETARAAIVPDGRGLPAGGAREGELAGHLGRLRRGGGPGGLLRRAEVARVSLQPLAPEPEFWVLDAVAIPHAAEPTLSFRMRVSEGSDRDVYTIALKAQIQLEASERPHSEESRERLRDVFGEPERWNDTARGVLWTCRDVLVPSFQRVHEVRAPGALLDRPRAGHDPLLRRGARWPRAARIPLQRLDHLRRGPRSHAGGARALARDGPVPPAGRGLARGDGRRRARPAERGHVRGTARARVRPGAALERRGGGGPAGSWRGPRPREHGGRRAGRLAALRGLRPLPVHARRHEERHAHAVRHRLSARLRRAQPELLRAPADRVPAGGRRRGVGRGALPAALGRAARGRGAAHRPERAGPRGVRAPAVARARAAPDRGARRRPPAREPLRAQRDAARQRGHRSRRGAAALAHLHPRGAPHLGGPLPLAARRARGQPEHLSGARHAGRRHGARRDDRAARPSADRAREPRQPLRQHRDRGGPAAPRAGAQRRRARRDRAAGSGRAGDDRARRDGHARRI